MDFRFKQAKGFSLLELLVVLAIVGILSILSIFMLGDRRGGAVRGVMDEIEGVLLSAQRNAMSTGADITISALGNWKDGTLTIDGRRWDPAAPTTRLGSNSEVFTSGYLRGQRDHMNAGVVLDAGYATALGSAPALVTVDPGRTEPFFSALGNNFCSGVSSSVTISGITKRFNQGFCIYITGIRGGDPVPGGPVGVIVAPAGMTSVFKFYKREGETQWRRL